MLNDFFKFLSPVKSKSVKPRPLMIKTIYSSSGPTINQELLSRQREVLLLDPIYQQADIVLTSLSEEDLLIGLTKHPRPLFGGVFMYPAEVRHTDTWKEIEINANQQQTGIAIFKPSQTVGCLKILQPLDEAIRYLIDHRSISLVERLACPAS